MKFVIPVFMGLLISSCFPSRVGMRYTAADDGYQSFYLGVSEYYGVPEQDVMFVRERNIPDEDIPVVFFIAQRANVAPAEVCDMRSRGASWMDISLHYGIDPEAYYMPVDEVSGPYGKAYGYYREKPRAEWKNIRLSDDDVVNFVNLRFVSEHYNHDAHDVMQMRSHGDNFVTIHNRIRQNSHGRDENDRGKGRGDNRRDDHDH